MTEAANLRQIARSHPAPVQRIVFAGRLTPSQHKHSLIAAREHVRDRRCREVAERILAGEYGSIAEAQVALREALEAQP